MTEEERHIEIQNWCNSMSDRFDTMLNSYSRNAQFGEQSSAADIVLDDYEKSVFLTEAQEQIVLELYTGKNPYQDSFEKTEEIRRYLGNLVEDDTLNPISNSGGTPLGGDSKCYFFSFKQRSSKAGTRGDLWFIVFEEVKLSNDESNGCKASSVMEVVPVTHDEYNKLKKNPFRGANSNRALRLDLNEDVVEIRCNYKVASYHVRYIKKLMPIILVDLSNDGLNINGKTELRKCELHEALHQKILERAVVLAYQSKAKPAQ